MEGHLHIPVTPCTSSDPASTPSAIQLLVSLHPWLMEEELLLNDSSAANPKFRSSAFGCWSQGTGPGEPEVANPQKRKSPRKSCSSRLTFSSRDRFSSAQHSGSSIFLAADLLQDVFLLPGESFAGRRGVEEGELCDRPRMTGHSISRRNSLFWNCLALIAPEDLQLLQTGFSFWLSVPAVG